MWTFLLGFLAFALGVPIAVLLALPYPIKLALKIVWKIYCIVLALVIIKWAITPLYGSVDYISGGTFGEVIRKHIAE